MLHRNLIAGEGLGPAAVWWHPFCDDRKLACQEVNVLHTNDMECIGSLTCNTQVHKPARCVCVCVCVKHCSWP